MINYKNMTNKEILEQLEWSDSCEFSYGYSMWAFKEIERLNNIIKEVREYIENNTNSNSYTTLTSGKTTDIGYCLVVFEDILEILDKGSK